MLKPGIKSTEFWSAAFLNLAIFVSTFTSSLPGKDQLIAAVIVNGLYTASRTIVKFKNAGNLNSVLQTISTISNINTPTVQPTPTLPEVPKAT